MIIQISGSVVRNLNIVIINLKVDFSNYQFLLVLKNDLIFFIKNNSLFDFL